MEYRISRYSTLMVEVDVDLPTSTKISKHRSPIELIGLLFTLRHRCNHFQVSENGEQRLIEQQEIPKVPLCDHQFPIEMFNEGNNSLFEYLSWSFQDYKPRIDAEHVADTLIERWIEIRDQVNLRSCDNVFSMTVNLTILDVVALHEIGSDGSVFGGEDVRMVPACGKAVRTMLKRLEIVEEDEKVCVICLDELKKKKNGRCGLQMPCLHVFHGKCIEDWLNNSHWCPICRFELPINSNYCADFWKCD